MKIHDDTDAKLLEKYHQLQAILDNMPAIISLTDSEGRFILVNEEFARTYGFPSKEAAEGKTDFDIHPPDRAEVASAYNRFTMETGEFLEREVVIAGGEGRTYLVSKFPVHNADGKPVAVGSIGTDITQRKRHEKELGSYQRSQAVGLLTSRVAHDFNNILAVLMGNLQLLSLAVSDFAATGLIDTCIKAVEQGGGLTANLLTLSGRHSSNFELTYLDDEIARLCPLLEAALSEKHTLKISCNSSAVTRVVQNQLNNALINLVVNADHAMGDQAGTITLATRIAENRFVEIAVIDEGPGIPEELRDKVIEPFFTTKERGTGTGLGLAMVNGFAEQSHGYFRIKGSVRGARIIIGLPIVNMRNVEQVPKPAKSEDNFARILRPPDILRETSEYQVLLVDDNVEILKFLESLLAVAKIRSVKCESFVAVQNAFDQNPHIDLALIDLHMPDINGIELCKWILARNPTLMTVLMSGNLTDDDIEAARAVGVEYFLSKPFSIKEVMYILLNCRIGRGDEILCHMQNMASP